MKKITLIIICLFSFTILYAQKLHDPSQVLKIMSDSKLAYQIADLKKEIPCPDYSNKLNYHGFYRVIDNDSSLTTYSITPNDKAKTLFDKAESLFKTNPDSAIHYYNLSLEADSTLYNVMTYIGQVYEGKKDYPNAITWYKMAISKNYIDYMAHWFLADNYLYTGKIDEAFDEILIAKILNRNHAEINKSMVRILSKAGIKVNDWCFCPQSEITKIDDNTISLKVDSKWVGYAMTKALWLYEPGYRESMGGKQDTYTINEDHECLINEIVSLINAKTEIKGNRQLMALKDAADKKFLTEFILYEIVLPGQPAVAYQLPEQSIGDIKNYLLQVRYSKK